MKKLREAKHLLLVLALAGVTAVAVAAVAFADVIFADGDGVAPIGDNNMSFGSVSCGQDTSKNALIGIRRNGNYPSGAVFEKGSTVTVDVEEITGTNASAVSATFAGGASSDTVDLPSSWDTTNTNDFAADTVASAVKIHPTSSGAGSATIKYRASGPKSNGGALTITDNMNVSWNAGTCVTNSAPSVPGAPALAGGSSTPNQGVFGLEWTASTDDGLPAGSSISYQLQHKDADDLDYSDVTGATALSTNSFSFTSGSPEGEGTWTYKVRASDGTLQSAYSAESGAVKVDKTGPSAPTAGFDRTPEDGDGGWFKDTVTVSYSGSTDPVLADGSAGSGVASQGTPQTFNTSGTHAYSGTATDNAGNASSATTGSAKVDATDPSVSIASGCPSGYVVVGSSQSIEASASDAHSGLAGDSVQDGDSVALDTSSIGPASKTVTAKDKVGRTKQATCNYTVAYGFAGFLAPINGTAVNAGKTGRTYPIKWQLKQDDGNGNLSLISDTDAQALVSQMSGGQIQLSCGQLIDESDVLEESTSGNTALRYDSTADQFIYNYKAPSTAGCYAFGVRKHNGVSTKQVDFNFTR